MLQYVSPILRIDSQTQTKTNTTAKTGPMLKKFDSKEFFADGRQHIFASCGIDTGGCSYYRMKFVDEAIEQKYIQAISINTRAFFNDIKHPMFRRLDSLRMQRPNHSNNFKWYNEVLLPAKKNIHPFRLIYDTDDILVPEDMPPYNCYRHCFPQGGDAIPFFLNASDIITVSTRKLADYYCRKFSVDPRKFCICRNYPPRYIFDRYSELERQRSFEQIGVGPGKRKPRICFSCSPSHFDFKNINHGDDDFSEIMPWIMENRHRYEFVFHGGMNRALYEKRDDFIAVPYGNFLNYPQVRHQIDADLYIQPLKKSFFNECKSAIKVLEAWGEGRPIFVQDIESYKELSPESCFGSVDQLANMVDSLFSGTVDNYMNIVRKNYARMENYWLEAHVDDWVPIVLKH